MTLRYTDPSGVWRDSPDPARGYDLFSMHFGVVVGEAATITLRHSLSSEGKSRRSEWWQAEVCIGSFSQVKTWDCPLKEATAKKRALHFFGKCLWSLERKTSAVRIAYDKFRGA